MYSFLLTLCSDAFLLEFKPIVFELKSIDRELQRPKQLANSDQSDSRNYQGRGVMTKTPALANQPTNHVVRYDLC